MERKVGRDRIRMYEMGTRKESKVTLNRQISRVKIDTNTQTDSRQHVLLHSSPVQVLSFLVLCRAFFSPSMNLVELVAQLPPLIIKLVPLLVKNITLLLNHSKLFLEGIESVAGSFRFGIVKLSRELLGAGSVRGNGIFDRREGFNGSTGALEGGDFVEGLLLGSDGELTSFNLGLEVPAKERKEERKNRNRRAVAKGGEGGGERHTDGAKRRRGD